MDDRDQAQQTASRSSAQARQALDRAARTRSRRRAPGQSPRSSGGHWDSGRCPMCGNHGAHQCGTEWRLANGTVGERPRRRAKRAGKSSSVRTVFGGLPTLGKGAR